MKLAGRHIFIRLVEHADLPKRVEWINAPKIQKTLNFDYPVSLAKTENWFDDVIRDRTRRDFSIFTVDKEVYIGFCGLLDIQMPTMKAELYVTIGDSDYWNMGYGTEAIKLVTDYGFNELGLNRIYAYQLPDNLASHRAFDKLNWKREGLLRQDIYSHGKFSDRYIISILKEEWVEGRN